MVWPINTPGPCYMSSWAEYLLRSAKQIRSRRTPIIWSWPGYIGVRLLILANFVRTKRLHRRFPSPIPGWFASLLTRGLRPGATLLTPLRGLAC